MIIDCDRCLMRDIACKECVVSVLINPAEPISTPQTQQVGVDQEEARIIDLLASRGMIPPLRYAQNSKLDGNSQDSQALSG